jgi:polar amino acid transport system permease protein
VSGAARLLADGLLVTLGLTVCGAALAALLGFGAGLMRVSRDPILRFVSRAYVELFRGTSALVQLYWAYYALPLVLDIELSAWTAGVWVLGLNTGAYAAEVVRGALLAVPREQDEAALALGLALPASMRHVILPQALPAMLPALSNLLVELLKASAIVSLITLQDLTFAADLVRADTLQTAGVYAVVLGLYFVVAQVLTAVMGTLERRLGRFRSPAGLAEGPR